MAKLAKIYDDQNSEIDLRELLSVLWEGKWLIAGAGALASVGAMLILLMLPNVYRAEALLAPNQNDGGGPLANLATQLGGLASLTGIDFRDGSVDKTALGLEVLKSRQFAAEFVHHHNILVPLMAANGWDRKNDELKIDSSDYDTDKGTWVRRVSWPRKTVPSMQEAHEEFMKIVQLSQSKETGFVTISVDHYSPSIAKQWVDWLVADINSTIMHRDVNDAERSIAFLQEQASATSLAGLQNVFFRLIEEQTKTVMLAKASDEYLFKTLDPAVAPEKRLRPRRLLITVLVGIFGLLIGALLNFLRVDRTQSISE